MPTWPLPPHSFSRHTGLLRSDTGHPGLRHACSCPQLRWGSDAETGGGNHGATKPTHAAIWSLRTGAHAPQLESPCPTVKDLRGATKIQGNQNKYLFKNQVGPGSRERLAPTRPAGRRGFPRPVRGAPPPMVPSRAPGAPGSGRPVSAPAIGSGLRTPRSARRSLRPATPLFCALVTEGKRDPTKACVQDLMFISRLDRNLGVAFQTDRKSVV